MQKKDRRAVGRPQFRVADVQHAGLDALERPEAAERRRRDTRLRKSWNACCELGGNDTDCCLFQK
ncbi:hypothetical protein D9M72_347000 [compost metagenome]